jgi:hypothetical protein
VRISLPLVVIPSVALLAVAAIHAQIANPIADPIIKRGLSVQVRDVVRLPDTRVAARRPGRRAGRLGAGQLCPRSSGRAPFRERLARVSLPARSHDQSADGLCECRRRVPDGRLQPARERVHRLRLPPGLCAERTLLYRARRARARQSAAPNFIPPGFTAADVNYHNIITEWHATNPAANTFEGTRRDCSRRPDRHYADAPVRRRRVQPDREARLARLRAPLHERQRSRVQQRRRAACETRADAAPRHAAQRDPPHRSAQPSVSGGTKGLGDYTIPAINKFARGRRPEDLRRNLRVWLPQRPPAVLGPHRWDDVRRTSA